MPIFTINELIHKCASNYELYSNELCKDKRKQTISFKTVAKIVLKMVKFRRLINAKDRLMIKRSELFKNLLNEHEMKALELAPTVDGRIKRL